MANLDFETATAGQVEDEISSWHESHFGSIQGEIARNPNATAALLRRIFAERYNHTNDLACINHPNCPSDLKDGLRRRINTYIIPEE